MKEIIVRSVSSALFSVFFCVLFLGGIIPGLPLGAGIPCAFAATLAVVVSIPMQATMNSCRVVSS